MSQPARLAFGHQPGALKEGGAGETTSRPPRHLLQGGDSAWGHTPCNLGHAGKANLSRNPLAVAFAALLMVIVQSCGFFFPVEHAYADQTIKFENGNTARQDDEGKLWGTCVVTAIWHGEATSFVFGMPDGQAISAHCALYGAMAPVDDTYEYMATPIGDGSYNVHVFSDRAEYLQLPGSPRIPRGSNLIQPTESDSPWRPSIVRGGLLSMKKASTLPSVTDALATYDLSNAKFSVWRNEACTISADNLILTTKSDGTAPAATLDAGTYWLREDDEPKGFLPASAPVRFEIKPTETTFVTMSNNPVYEAPTAIAKKVDGEINATLSVTTSLEGLKDAEFTVRYYDGYYTALDLPSSPKRTWVLRSDATGRVALSSDSFVNGSPFYTNQAGRAILPLGTIAIQETKAPYGYFLEGQVPGSSSSYAAPVHVIRINGRERPLLQVGDLARTAGISVQKHDAQTGNAAQGDASLQGISFQIFNANQTSVTVLGRSYEPGAAIGSPLVTDATGKAATPKDFLPLGTYEVREISGNASYNNTAQAQRITLREEHTNTIVPCGSAFADSVVRGGVRIPKDDQDLSRNQAQGDASLEGAAFSVTLESSNPVVVRGRTYSKGQTVLTITTNAQGVAQTAASDLPYGTYTVRETQAPKGYHLNSDYKQTFSIRNDGQIVDLAPYPCRDAVIRGGVCLAKIDAELDSAQAQGDATLAGAEFSIYSESPQPIVVNGTEYTKGDVVSIIYANDKGFATTGDHELPYGTYAIRETAPSKGYLLNEAFEQSFSIRDDGTVIDLGSKACEEHVVRGGVAVGKVSRETSQHLPQGETSLAGAQFSITLQGDQPAMVNGNICEPNSVVCTIVTNEDGIASTEDRMLPFGTYVIRETEPPVGYLPNDDWSRTVQIREDGVIVDLTSEADSVDDQIMRGSLEFNKVAEDTMERMAHTVFRITSTTTGESHVAVTDENGLFNTEAWPHSRRTNANDTIVDSNDVVQEDAIVFDAGMWFSGRDDLQTTPNDQLGALPYDTYEVRELASKANAGHELVTFTVRIRQHGYHASMGTIDDKKTDRPDPKLSTTLAFDGTNHVAPVTERVTLVDTIRYEGLTPDTSYEIVGELVDRSTGELLRTGSGDSITSTASLTPTTASGYTELSFTFDSTALDGVTAVAFEHLMLDGSEVASHADLDDEGQTMRFPSIGTTFADRDGSHEAAANEERVSLVDAVTYTNLEAGKTYEMLGSLVDKRTGEKLLDSDGRELTSVVSFVANESDGTVDVPFTIPTRTVQGTTIVAFEQVRRLGTVLASHEDQASEAQTVSIPRIRTELTDEAGSHVITSERDVVLVDHVSYANLNASTTYTVRGTLYDKDTGKPIRTEEGATIESITTFTPDKADGTADIKFTVRSSLIAGKQVVAFESLMRDDREIAVHADLEDAGQTVYAPIIGTTLVGPSDEHEVAATEQLALVDTVSYRGLAPGIEYRMRGSLMDASTGKALTDSHGNPIVVEQTFEPESSSGYVRMPFEINGIDHAGKTIVCFESLLRGKGDKATVIARHEDMHDEGQTIAIPRISTHASDAEDGDDYLLGSGTVRIRDEVSFENLRPGVEYVMQGTLYAKGTGTALTNADGSTITASHAFTPSQPNGTVTLEFSFDTTRISETSVVVFETCLRDNHEVAVHADIHDEEQTVHLARIRTTATDAKGNHTTDATSNLSIVDTVTFEGLLPGTEYKLEGTLYNRQSGEPVKDAAGKTVTAQTSFTPNASDGQTQVTFEFDASRLGGSTLVAFEKLTTNDRLVATHEDLSDDQQSVILSKPKEEAKPNEGNGTGSSDKNTKEANSKAGSTPRTGEQIASYVLFANAGILALTAGVSIARRHRY